MATHSLVKPTAMRQNPKSLKNKTHLRINLQPSTVEPPVGGKGCSTCMLPPGGEVQYNSRYSGEAFSSHVHAEDF